MLADFRRALRALAKAPTFAIAAVLCVMLGIGANTAIFSLVNAVLLKPMPVRGIDRMVVVREDLPKLKLMNTELDPPSVAELAARKDLFEQAASVQSRKYNLNAEDEEPARIGGARTLGDFFELFGATAAVGRLYDASQSRDGRDRVVVLSYGFWRERFGGDASIVGKTIRLSGLPFEVIGVASPELRYPRDADLWAPYPVDSTLSQQKGRLFMTMVGRMQPGVTKPQLDDALARQAQVFSGTAAAPGTAADLVLRSVPFVDFLAGELRPIVLLLMAAVVLVLLIACANVACLQLVRSTGRVRELSVRAALGASAREIVRPLLAESLLLATVGGVLGIALGALIVRAVARWGPAQYPMLREAHLDPAVLSFAVLATALAAVVFSVAPALRVSRADPQDALRANTRGASAGVERHRFLQGAVIVQVALALTLVLTSGLMIRSLSQLVATNPGFKPDQVLTAQFSLPGAQYPESERREAFVDRVLARLSATPGLQAAGIVAYLPFAGGGDSSPFTIVGAPADPNGNRPHSNYNIVSEGYFSVMGMPLLAGRAFAATDTRAAAPVVIIDEQLAKEFFPGENPIGRRIEQLGFAGPEQAPVIIGVVGSVKQETLGKANKATIYYSFRQNTPGAQAIVVRGSLPPASFTSAVRGAVAEQDRGIPLYDVRLMRERVEDSLGARRLAVWVLGAFAALALGLALLGITGVLSYTVTQRTHELGVRVALGARSADIVRLVLWQGTRLTVAGVALGAFGFFLADGVLASLLVGVQPDDPETIIISAALLGAVALLASWLPARRAAKADAMTALRQA